MTPAIDIVDLTVTFGSPSKPVTVVKEVNMRVERGESFGLVGESGSGKSTILRCIAGLAQNWTGRITRATDEKGTSRPVFSRNVQMVFQDPYASLHPRLTVERTLMEPVRIHGLDDPAARVVAALDAVGLDRRFLYRYPHQLSGGQRQRVAIARAMILEPSILLLDEPTSALDVSVQAEVLNVLTALRKERALTYVLVSHDLGVITHMCERAIVLRGGRVEEQLRRDDIVVQNSGNAYVQRLMADSILAFDRVPS
ncbi:ABC transporter ATP-binding protein [Devosia ginsengisoli]|uniref:ABC transporter ATP-binding protein n=1 Tax=Devosia ginsengisoli TaxID=400770 RepID=UPI0026F02F0B|nr:ABC transporter ATP-binding protein [Devosia ginsengisoli]MCR6670765.1 ABC transporter ATP-binding protein [Devosia ginsengisoli]